MEILEVIWFTGIKTVGIVIAKNTVGEPHVYVGSVDGIDEENDIAHIIDYGSKKKLEDFLKFVMKHATMDNKSELDGFIEFAKSKGYKPMKENPKHRPGEGYSPPKHTECDWETLKEESKK